MQLHDVLVKTTKRGKRIGRGGKRGTTSGRGTKGQKSRAGHKIRPAIRDLIKKLPKKRGVGFHKNKRQVYVIDFTLVSRHFKDGEKVTPRVLLRRGLIFLPNQKSKIRVKLLNRGELKTKLIFENIEVSIAAAEKIIALGGEIRNIE